MQRGECVIFNCTYLWLSIEGRKLCVFISKDGFKFPENWSLHHWTMIPKQLTLNIFLKNQKCFPSNLVFKNLNKSIHFIRLESLIFLKYKTVFNQTVFINYKRLNKDKFFILDHLRIWMVPLWIGYASLQIEGHLELHQQSNSLSSNILDVCFESLWQKQSQELTRVNPDLNIFPIKCWNSIYFIYSIEVWFIIIA